jgi:hypothetical protein
MTWSWTRELAPNAAHCLMDQQATLISCEEIQLTLIHHSNDLHLITKQVAISIFFAHFETHLVSFRTLQGICIHISYKLIFRNIWPVTFAWSYDLSEPYSPDTYSRVHAFKELKLTDPPSIRCSIDWHQSEGVRFEQDRFQATYDAFRSWLKGSSSGKFEINSSAKETHRFKNSQSKPRISIEMSTK